MNKLKFMSLLVGCLAAVSLTSCNDDDDSYRSLTKEEKAQCYQTVRGNYSGKLVYATGETKNGKTVTDTIDAAWSVQTDSTLIIRQLPTRLLALHVTNTELKHALETAPAQDLVCRVNYTQTSPIGFLLNPVTPSYDLTFGGASHKVQVPFYTNVSQSFGLYSSDKKMLQLQVIEGGIYIDSKQSSDVKAGSAFYLFGTKL